jgi:hypothetical protein
LIFEIILQFLPVNEGFKFRDVNISSPIFRAEPNNEVVHSKFWYFYQDRKIKTNNEGFRNDIDYVATQTSPMVAVIGDSYVEAVQVDYNETFFSILHNQLQPSGRCYSFGFSGAPLSQYLIWAEYAFQKFKAQNVVFSIISNDFDESLVKYKQSKGSHFYVPGPDSLHYLQRFDYRRSFLNKAVSHSALARYLYANVQITALPQKFTNFFKDTNDSFVGNVASNVSSTRISDSQLAINLFFRDLPTRVPLPKSKVVFILDGRFYDMKEKEINKSYFGQMRNYFLIKAASEGYRVIDLKPLFDQDYAEHKKRFDFPSDGHWNRDAHAIVADSLFSHFKTEIIKTD